MRATPPVPITSFVGRRRELREVQRLVSGARLITFVGPGGCGKTRLALELSRRIGGDVVWVSLAHLRRGEDVRHEVARGVGVASPARLAEGLADQRNRTQRLLVLDNCEHVIDAAAAIAVELLSAQSRIRVLATSREPLDVEGELVWRVPPLALPDELSQDDPQRSGRADSVRLFVERARLAYPGFSLDQTAACRSVVAICRAVDGIPLAIELAAARLRHANVADLATHLDDLLALLVSTRRAGDSRHRGLRAALDWSQSLLDERQRSVLRRLSVFAGGFTIAAAESVCADGRLPAREVLSVVASLVDKSLLVPPTDGNRYRMLEPVREYASELLVKSAENDLVTERCIAHLVDLVSAELPDTMGVGAGPSIRRVSDEFANLNAVLPRLIERRPADAVRVLSRFAQNHWGLIPAHLSTVSAWLSRALDAYVLRDVIRVEGLLGQVQVMLQQDHDHVAARRLADEAVAISNEFGDELLRARALSRSAFVAAWDDPPRALREYDRSVPVLRLFHPGALALALAGRAVLRQRSGDARGADEDLSESFAAWQRQNVELSLSPALTFLAAADVAFQRGEISRADSCIKEALLTEQRFHALSPQLIGHLVSPVLFAAHLAALQGDDATALRLAGFADRMHYESGAMPRAWFALSDRAWLLDLETRLGARAQKLRTEGRNLSGVQAVALALGKRPATSLTSRELAVCALVADGMTDKEIASHLSISERTAESHVQRIREKLKFRSRTQIGRWAAEQSALAEAAVK